MSTTSDRYRQIWESLATHESREGFVEAEIDEVVAAQIRAMREDRGWTQKELGDRTEMAQATICTLENPNYGKYSLRTLKRLSSAFDVGLFVRFVPFTRLTDWAANLSREDLSVPSFDEESASSELANGLSDSSDMVVRSPSDSYGSVEVRGEQMVQIGNVIFMPKPPEFSASPADVESIRVS